MHIGNIGSHGRHLGNSGQNGMPVCLDHAGHQRAATAIDHVCVCDRFLRADQRLDEIAFHQNILAFNQFCGCAIKNLHIGEENRFCRGFGLRHRRAVQAEGRDGKRCCGSLEQITARQLVFHPGHQLQRLRAVAGATPSVNEVPVFLANPYRQDTPSARKLQNAEAMIFMLEDSSIKTSRICRFPCFNVYIFPRL